MVGDRIRMPTDTFWSRAGCTYTSGPEAGLAILPTVARKWISAKDPRADQGRRKGPDTGAGTTSAELGPQDIRRTDQSGRTIGTVRGNIPGSQEPEGTTGNTTGNTAGDTREGMPPT